MVRVLLDATAIPADRGGVGRYLDGLIPALSRLDELDTVVVCQQRDAALYRAQAPGSEIVVAPAPIAARGARLAWEQTGLPALVRRLEPDVLHSPHYTMPFGCSMPLGCSAPVVVTLHDATFFSHPQLHSRLKRQFFTTATRLAVRRAAGLIVPSAASRDELVRLVSPAAQRAVVAPHGVDARVFYPPPADEVAALRAELGIGDRRFVAFLGTVEPRKNVPNLIRGWAGAFAGRADAPALVIAGAPGWDRMVDPAAEAVPEGLRLVRPGYLELDRLRALLGGADVVAYPALGEGFGLPVAEAMACGAAVLTTRRLALPEVGGDAVAYCEPDAAAIGSALAELCDAPRRRDELAERALKRAGRFTWAAAAQAHAAAYRAAAKAAS